MTEPALINSPEDFDCDICKLPLRGYKGYIAYVCQPVDLDKPEGFHRIIKAIHPDCFTCTADKLEANAKKAMEILYKKDTQ